MLSASQIKYLKSLQVKKYRKREKKIILEGSNLIYEALMANYPINTIWYHENQINDKIIELAKSKFIKIDCTSKKSIDQISETIHHQGIIALANITNYNTDILSDNKIIALDGIKDPGNLGTIIRTSVWFGIKSIILSKECVDPFNAKVIRSGMGGHFYLNNLHICSLEKMITNLKNNNYKIIGTDIKGKNINRIQINNKWVVIIGSEINGISKNIKKIIDKTVTIPGTGNIESLNAAIANGIILNKLFSNN